MRTGWHVFLWLLKTPGSEAMQLSPNHRLFRPVYVQVLCGRSGTVAKNSWQCPQSGPAIRSGTGHRVTGIPHKECSFKCRTCMTILAPLGPKSQWYRLVSAS
jgi:hypothetical protein